MRTALAAIGLLLLAACSDTPPPAAPDTSSSAPATTTSAAPTALLPLWEKRLPTATPRGACPIEATFELSCFQAILDFRKVVEEIGDQADALGSRYAPVERAAAEVDEAIEEWTTVCATSAAGSSERIRCLGPLNRVMTGNEAILAAIYAVERP